MGLPAGAETSSAWLRAALVFWLDISISRRDQ
jgi:hypothetical protein